MTFRVKLFAKKARYAPTLWGWALLCLALVLPVVFGGARADAFLAYSRPIDANILIVEGWVPDYVLEAALMQLEGGAPELIVTTGGPLDRGAHLARYNTYAELAAASLLALGAPAERVKALPCPQVEKDRTRESALEVRRWLLENPGPNRLKLITLGPHARRSYLIYRRLLPSTYALGVDAVPDQQYDPDRWWRTSAGVREVMSEAIAYLYARCCE